MSSYSIGFVLLLGILIIYFYYDDIEAFVNNRKVCNKIDHRCYDVVGKFDGHKDASDTLANLNEFMIAIIRHMRRKYF